MRRHIWCTMLLGLALAGAGFASNRMPAQAAGAGDLPALTVLVRHADKAPEADPDTMTPLSAAGMQRAQDLAAVLHNTKFAVVITTQYIRTGETAQPTAAALGLTPEVVAVDPYHLEAHVRAVSDAVRRHAGGAVIVVDHSNLIPAIIAALGGPRLKSDLICDDIYDHLFVLVPVGGQVQLISARYGAPSPPPGPDCM